MTHLHLKPLSVEDLPSIVELDRTCFGRLWTEAGYRRELESPNSDLPGLFATDENGVSLVGLGCLWAILDEAHLTLLAVLPPYRRHGLGRLLLQALLRSARQRGLERATLEVSTANHAARSLYEQFGFREAGRRQAYYPNGEDASILWLSGIQNAGFLQKLEDWDRQLLHRLDLQGWKILKTY
ncbi:ribosomal protein S18-alanine N-acetyltransferase [Geitlerinema sp. CS-897]|nr:ribosomal protein S18-alanine N-acetyltransferase [Geitlerinema sp. CS-897]